MQTFVMYHSIPKTMRDLDQQRLGKQRVEAKQILSALEAQGDEDAAWGNHPAVQMWLGYEPALILYGLFCCHEWRIVRKFNDSLWGHFADKAKEYGMLEVDETCRAANMPGDVEMPPWLANRWVLRSHRSKLMAKNPALYGKKYLGTPEDMPYLWPVNDWKLPEKYWLRLSAPDLRRIRQEELVLPFGVDLVDEKIGRVEVTEDV
jgi:hypothetical protein